ncbi:hypothetical protein Tco_0677012 [Tanacetum coccineum]
MVKASVSFRPWRTCSEHASSTLEEVGAEVGEGQLIGPKIVQETTEKISQIKDRLKEEPVDILEREIKKLKRSRIPIVKDRWNSK